MREYKGVAGNESSFGESAHIECKYVIFRGSLRVRPLLSLQRSGRHYYNATKPTSGSMRFALAPFGRSYNLTHLMYLQRRQSRDSTSTILDNQKDQSDSELSSQDDLDNKILELVRENVSLEKV